MASSSRANSDFSIWISDHEGGDEETELSGLRGEDHHRKMDDDNSETLPRWKNYESIANLDKFKAMLEDLDIDSDPESDEESDSNENTALNWTDNFDTFTGEPFTFDSETGPTIASTDPLFIFTSVWDKDIMRLIARETNRYARQMAELQQNQDIPENHTLVEWKDTTVEELYIMFVLIIYSSITKKVQLFQGPSALPVFAQIMDLKRFKTLNRCLHFIDNTTITELPYRQKMLAKIKPIMNHCNEKFSALYKPGQYLALDDSLLLGKGDIKKNDRWLANCFGIRTYELYEATTGYILKNLQFPGSDARFTSRDKTKIALDLLDEYSKKGHIVVADKYFTSVHFARTLKSRGFDILCEVKQTSRELPEVIRQLCEVSVNQNEGDEPTPNQLNGNEATIISKHCGDITVATNTFYNLTIFSTYHTSQMVESRGTVRGNVVTMDYFDLKDKMFENEDMLSDFLNPIAGRWYVKQFKRLLNITLGNSYIIYKSNIQHEAISQISFRRKLANRLLYRYGDRKMVAKVKSVTVYDNNDTSDDSFAYDMFSDDDE